jgi:hypothetical protein
MVDKKERFINLAIFMGVNMSNSVSKFIGTFLMACSFIGCGSVKLFDKPMGQPIAESNSNQRPVEQKNLNSNQNLSCDTCQQSEPVFYAITRPMLCNDYPVTHRLNYPGHAGKVNIISSVEISSTASTFKHVSNNEVTPCR